MRRKNNKDTKKILDMIFKWILTLGIEAVASVAMLLKIMPVSEWRIISSIIFSAIVGYGIYKKRIEAKANGQ